MASHCCRYNWRASRVENIIPKTNSLPANVFFIQIRSRDYVINQNLSSKNLKDRYVTEPLSPMKLKSLFVKKDLLLKKEEEAQAALRDVLGFMGVPAYLHNVVIDEIVAFGWRMVDFTPRQDVLPMVLHFAAITVETTDESDDVPNPNPARALADMPLHVAKRRRV